MREGDCPSSVSFPTHLVTVVGVMDPMGVVSQWGLTRFRQISR